MFYRPAAAGLFISLQNRLADFPLRRHELCNAAAGVQSVIFLFLVLLESRGFAGGCLKNGDDDVCLLLAILDIDDLVVNGLLSLPDNRLRLLSRLRREQSGEKSVRLLGALAQQVFEELSAVAGAAVDVDVFAENGFQLVSLCFRNIHAGLFGALDCLETDRRRG